MQAALAALSEANAHLKRVKLAIAIVLLRVMPGLLSNRSRLRKWIVALSPRPNETP